MTSFILKIVGLICMFADHLGDAIIGHFSYFNLIGRIAFPIFAFQLVQGYIHTKNLKKHIIKLFIFACISQIPFSLFLYSYTGSFSLSLNVLFTFLLALMALYFYDNICNINKSKKLYKLFGFIAVIFISVLAQFLKVDYGWYGVLLVFFFYICQNNKILLCISTIILSILKYVPSFIEYGGIHPVYIQCIIFTCLSLAFILPYNQKEGPKAKYLFYIFYPLHLLVLYFLQLF